MATTLTHCNVSTKDIEFLFYWRNSPVNVLSGDWLRGGCGGRSSSTSRTSVASLDGGLTSSVGSFRFSTLTELLWAGWGHIDDDDDRQRSLIASHLTPPILDVFWSWCCGPGTDYLTDCLGLSYNNNKIYQPRQDSLTYYCCFLPSQ